MRTRIFPVAVLILALSLALAPGAGAAVPVQRITVVNHAHIGARQLARIERALVAQSHQLRDWWGTPLVAFGPGGWILDLQARRDATERALGDSATGYHSVDYFVSAAGAQGSVPELHVIARDPPWAHGGQNCDASGNHCVAMSAPWSVTFSHEILETLADPVGKGVEVCDAVVDGSYRLRGVWVSDFVTTRWYQPARHTAFDQMRALTYAGERW